MILEGKKAVIFDLDGTLVDSMWMWKEIDIEFLGQRGISVPKSLQRSLDGMSFSEVALYFKSHFQLEESLEEIKEIWNTMAFEKYRFHVPLKPGVLPFLKFLKEHDIKIGIASSNSVELIEAVLEAHNIREYFDCILTCCQVAKGKPAPDVYLETARQLGVEPDKCLVFEDIPAGIQAGRSAGMTTCAVEDDYSKDMIKEKKELANYYIQTYEDIFRHTYEEL